MSGIQKANEKATDWQKKNTQKNPTYLVHSILLSLYFRWAINLSICIFNAGMLIKFRVTFAYFFFKQKKTPQSFEK